MRKENLITCNCCGKLLQAELQKNKQEWIHIEKEWGYFSNKDGRNHKFDLCEECYDKFVQTFLIPVEEFERTELL